MGVTRYSLIVDGENAKKSGKTIHTSTSNLIVNQLKNTGEDSLSGSALKKWGNGTTMTIIRQHCGALSIMPTEVHISNSINDDTLPLLAEHIWTIKNGTIHYKSSRENRKSIVDLLDSAPSSALEGNEKIWYLRVSKWDHSDNPVRTLIKRYHGGEEADLMEQLKDEAFKEMIMEQRLEFYLTIDEQKKIFAGTKLREVNQAAESDQRTQRSLADIRRALGHIAPSTTGTVPKAGKNDAVDDLADSILSMASSTALEVFDAHSMASSATSVGEPSRASEKLLSRSEAIADVVPSGSRKNAGAGPAKFTTLEPQRDKKGSQVTRNTPTPPANMQDTEMPLTQSDSPKHMPRRVHQLRYQDSSIGPSPTHQSPQIGNGMLPQSSPVSRMVAPVPSAQLVDEGYVFSLSDSADTYLSNGNDVLTLISSLNQMTNTKWSRSSVGLLRDPNVPYKTDGAVVDLRHMFNGQPDYRVTCRETYLIPNRPYSRTVSYHMSKQDLEDVVDEMIWSRKEGLVSKIDWVMFQEELEEVGVSGQSDMEEATRTLTTLNNLHNIRTETWWKLIEGQLATVDKLQADLRKLQVSSGESGLEVRTS